MQLEKMCVRKETLVFCAASANRGLKVEHGQWTCDVDFFQKYPKKLVNLGIWVE